MFFQNLENRLDAISTGFVAEIFNAVGGPLTILLMTMGTLALIGIAINQALQLQDIKISTYLSWAVRFFVVLLFVTSWTYFGTIYKIVQDVPKSFVTISVNAMSERISEVTKKAPIKRELTAAEKAKKFFGLFIPIYNIKAVADLAINGLNPKQPTIFDPKKITSVGSAIDEFGRVTFYVARTTFEQWSIWNPGNITSLLLGTVIWVLGIVFLTTAAIVSSVAKIGFAMAFALGPLALVCLALPQTKEYFGSWVRFVLGFAVVPLLLGVLMSLMMFLTAETILADVSGTSRKLSDFLGFLITVLAATVLLFQLPSLASSLAGTTVVSMGPAAMAGVASTVGGFVGKGLGAAASPMRFAKNAAHASSVMREKGGSSIGSALKGMYHAGVDYKTLRADRAKTRAEKFTRDPKSSSTGSGPTGGGGSGSSNQLSQEQMNKYDRPQLAKNNNTRPKV